jgi:O-6-methylguanine DNA methyltransferase
MGQLVTYGAIAQKIDKPNASRAVGTAIGSNPVAFLIPCHRVISSTGTFGGYMWGNTRKTAIIGWEGAKTSAEGQSQTILNSKMDLVNNKPDEKSNLLPKDGIVNYYGKLFSNQQANTFLQILLNQIEWKNDEAIIFGKRIITKRKVAWYGDHGLEYTYSNITKKALPWTKELLILKTIVEEKTGEQFNSCLLNLYHTGDEGMAWHSDAEKDLAKNGAIGSLSFGAERNFAFKHKESKETVSLTLENGSLLIMKGTTQSHWLHRLPLTKRILTPRVNLTFRMIVRQ